MPKTTPPPGVSSFGNDGGCSLDTCPIDWSIYGYRPSLPANVVFTSVFAVIGLVHFYLGLRWRTWGFTLGMLLGCVTEVIGYVGRVLLWKDPFGFNPFLIQIICLTIAPVFYTASIYVTLSKTILHLAPSLSRFPPNLFYYIFIPADILCLALQAAGGAMSSNAHGDTSTGVNISMAGLALQVAVLVIFIAFYADYMLRYMISARKPSTPTSTYNASSSSSTGHGPGVGWRFKVFIAGISASTLLILTRCVYRVAELQDGYAGKLIAEEVPFIVLEGVVVALAAAALGFGHPGLVFDREAGSTTTTSSREKSIQTSDSEGPAPRYEPYSA